MRRLFVSVFGAILLTIVNIGTASADFSSLLKQLTGTDSQSSTVSALSNSEMVGGLKEALAQGVRTAVKSLGKTDGYLGAADVRIPLPDTLSKIEGALRAVGQDALADEFVTTMNRAAEQAVPEAAEIFGNAISKMTLDDAKKILNGPDDAATDYFRRTSGEALVDRMHPIVASATDKVGVTSSYKSMMAKAGILAQFMDTKDLDLDRYVTGKAVDGLFKRVADEEKQIRQDPLARSTDLMKKVFGFAQ